MTYDKPDEKLALALRVWADANNVPKLKSMSVSEELAKTILFMLEEWGVIPIDCY